MPSYEIYWPHLWHEFEALDTVVGWFQDLQLFVITGMNDLIESLVEFRDFVQRAEDLGSIDNEFGNIIEIKEC
jgi:hypothetical protein